MNTLAIDRFSPLSLPGARSLRNRVVLPPMAAQTGSPEGLVTAATLAHYKRLARAQAGLMIVEYTFVHLTGRSESGQLGISSDSHVTGLRGLATLIRSSGALAGIQFSHGGGKTSRELTGGYLMGPSGIAVPVKDGALEAPDAMTARDIELWIEAFVAAAGRAAVAGFDLIELHSAHGYGLNQWLSPLTNQRRDQYGRGREGRSRLLLEIVRKIRINYPNLLISVRIPGQDFAPGGLEPTDCVDLGQRLEAAGVHLLHVSSGIGGWRRPRNRAGEGYLTEEAALIQKSVGIPVIGVGGIETGGFIDQGLQEGRFRLAAVGRAILASPESFHASCLQRFGSSLQAVPRRHGLTSENPG